MVALQLRMLYSRQLLKLIVALTLPGGRVLFPLTPRGPASHRLPRCTVFAAFSREKVIFDSTSYPRLGLFSTDLLGQQHFGFHVQLGKCVALCLRLRSLELVPMSNDITL